MRLEQSSSLKVPNQTSFENTFDRAPSSQQKDLFTPLPQVESPVATGGEMHFVQSRVEVEEHFKESRKETSDQESWPSGDALNEGEQHVPTPVSHPVTLENA